jgi:hypothetical protein
MCTAREPAARLVAPSSNVRQSSLRPPFTMQTSLCSASTWSRSQVSSAGCARSESRPSRLAALAVARADLLIVDHGLVDREGQERLQLERQHLGDALLRARRQLHVAQRGAHAVDGDDHAVRRTAQRADQLAQRAADQRGARGALLQARDRHLEVALDLEVAQAGADHRAAHAAFADVDAEDIGHWLQVAFRIREKFYSIR